MNTYLVEGVRYYGAYDTLENSVVYCMTDGNYISKSGSFPVSLAVAGGYMVVILLVGMFMLHPYTLESYKANVRLIESGQRSDLIEGKTAESLLNLTADEKSLSERWRELIPEEKSQFFRQTVLSIVLIGIFVNVLRFRGSSYTAASSGQRSTISFVLFGQWTHGLNYLGLAAVLIILLGFFIFIFIKGVLVRVLSSVLDPKGETIMRLAFSLLQYGVVIGGIYLMLDYIGLNLTIRLTSVSIVSLAISLGSKDIVSDILAGIFIIFENDFQVGDYVVIDGYSGIVKEIGVRSTKVIGLGDEIRIFGNQNIRNIVNKSKMNTWLTVEYTLFANIPLLEAEQLLQDHMDEFGERIPEIINGPFYRGIWGYDTYGGRPIFQVSCECTESNVRIIRRKLNHEIGALMEKNKRS